MNRLQFFKSMFRGAVGVAALPLAEYMGKAETPKYVSVCADDLLGNFNYIPLGDTWKQEYELCFCVGSLKDCPCGENQ